MKHSKGLVSLAAIVVAVLWGSAFGQQQNAQEEGQRRERGQRGRQDGAQDQGQQGREGRRDRGDRGRRGDGQNGQNDQNQGGERGRRGDGQNGPDAGGQRGGRDRGPGGFGGGPGGPGGRGGPREFTPEQREQFYEQMSTRQLERLTAAYELNPEQQTQAKGKLDELKAQQRAYSEEHMGDFTEVRRQMEQLREQGVGRDSPQAQELGQKMRSLFEGAPLMNRENVASSIEKLLPPEQAKRGREKWDAEGREWDQRREEMRQRFEQRRQEGGGGPGDEGRRGRDGRRGGPEGVAGPDGAANQPADGGRDGRGGREGGRWGRGERGGEGEQVGAWSPEAGGRQYRPIVENPVGPWEQYLRDFIRRYRLDDAQQATAWSVLREVQVRRTAYEQSMREDFAQARGLANINDRERRVESLNRPVVRMFDELKSRLDKIPSADQLNAYGPPRATSSQPAAAVTSRPS